MRMYFYVPVVCTAELTSNHHLICYFASHIAMSSAAELDWLQAGVARGNEPRHSRRTDPAADSESSSVAPDDAHVRPDGESIPEVLSQVIWKLLECLCSSWFS